MLQVQVETINHCNAACVFCPYPTMKRAKGVMPMELFEKIALDACAVPQVSMVTLVGLGEPLLDPRLVDRIRFVKSVKKDMRVDIFTNGTYLTQDMTDCLSEAGLDFLYVSLNAANAEKRKAIMRLDDFDKVEKQIRYAIKSGKFQTVVKGIVTKDLMEGDDSDIFLAKWGGPTSDGGRGYLHLEGNWAGATFPMRVKPVSACNRALTQIMVMWDGRVSLCCFDGEGEVVFGDLNSQTIKEVFNGPAALAYREAHYEGRRGELKLCATCTAI